MADFPVVVSTCVCPFQHYCLNVRADFSRTLLFPWIGAEYDSGQHRLVPVARGIGIVGSLAIIRFRTNLRDPRDLVFLFASLGIGVASGVQSYATAFIGTIVFCLIVFVLYISPFGTRRKHDGLVRFQIPSGPDAVAAVTNVLQAYTRNFVLVTMRNVAQGQVVDYAYQVKLADPMANQALIQQLETIEGIRGITYMNQEATVEV